MKKFTQSKQIHAQRPQQKHQNNVGNKFKVNNKHRPRSDVFTVIFTYFTRYCRVSIVDFEQENVFQEPLLEILIYSRAERRHRSTVFIFNFEHISHLILVLLLLILSMYLIAGYDISNFSRFQINMNSNFNVYSFLERISAKWNAHTLASSSKQDVFITNCNVNFFLYFLSFNK